MIFVKSVNKDEYTYMLPIWQTPPLYRMCPNGSPSSPGTRLGPGTGRRCTHQQSIVLYNI